MIVRSDGTVTYVGKDIAYQYWKLGLLGKDFNYRPFGTRLNGETLWTTSADSTDHLVWFLDGVTAFNQMRTITDMAYVRGVAS